MLCTSHFSCILMTWETAGCEEVGSPRVLPPSLPPSQARFRSPLAQLHLLACGRPSVGFWPPTRPLTIARSVAVALWCSPAWKCQVLPGTRAPPLAAGVTLGSPGRLRRFRIQLHTTPAPSEHTELGEAAKPEGASLWEEGPGRGFPRCRRPRRLPVPTGLGWTGLQLLRRLQDVP